ncbi:MAG: hypothetical protein O3A57_00890 [Bacteroidetes bacterium]|nr:hypothetical protein [Bacteroidota bacterium]
MSSLRKVRCTFLSYGQVKRFMFSYLVIWICIPSLAIAKKHADEQDQARSDTLDFYVDPEDAKTWVEANESAWLGQFTGILVSRWKWSSNDGSSSALGGPFAVRTQLRVATEDGVTLELSMSKDAFEPWGTGGRVPWKGPELIRGFLSGELRKWHFVGGHFKSTQGYRLTSGPRAYSSISRTNPLAMPASGMKMKGYSGTGHGPVRFGVAAVREIGPIRLHGWWSRSKTTARLEGFALFDGSTVRQLVVDVSSTSAFTSAKSLLRRRQLRLQATGAAIDMRTKRYVGSLLVESITARAGPDLDPAPALLSQPYVLTGWFNQFRFRSVRFSTESAFLGKRLTAWRSAIRTTQPRKMPSALIDVYHRSSSQTSPFSLRPAFKTTADKETSVISALSWRPWRSASAKHFENPWPLCNSTDEGAYQSKTRNGGLPKLTAGIQWRAHTFQDGEESRNDIRAFVSAIWAPASSNWIRATIKRAVRSDREMSQLYQTFQNRLFMLDVRHKITPTWDADLHLQIGAESERRISGRSLRKGLVILGLRRSRQVWSSRLWHAHAVGHNETTVFYASIPTVKGGFPLLAMAAPASRSVMKIALTHERWIFEALVQRIWPTFQRETEHRLSWQVTRIW